MSLNAEGFLFIVAATEDWARLHEGPKSGRILLAVSGGHCNI